MAIDPRLVAIWTDADLKKEIARQNRTAEHFERKAAAARQEAREIAAQLFMRHHDAQSA